MNVQQFFDDGLAHASYAILSDNEVAVVDPARDPKPYEDFAEANDAKIVAVFETHPHADFASSHMELHERHGATIYVNPKMQVEYPHQAIDDGESVQFGEVKMQALFTPGHSPDHNTYLLTDRNGNPHAVFTGDSLFVGDIGRPDLREGAGKIQAQREELAKKMFTTMKEVFQELPDEVMVYPAHGKGSLCGKNMSSETYSTIGKEKERNWALKVNNEQDFVEALLEGQPYVPKYFAYDVAINASGVKSLEEGIKQVPRLSTENEIDGQTLVIDARQAKKFKKGHLPNAINIPDDTKFETWIGSLIDPNENFYLVSDNKENLEQVIYKAAKIGYEQLIKGAAVIDENQPLESDEPNPDDIHNHPEKYTIIDVRNKSEVESEPVFNNSLNIPLHELREKWNDVPQSKPIAVHCAGGYRSAIGASILKNHIPEAEIHDVSESIKEIKAALA